MSVQFRLRTPKRDPDHVTRSRSLANGSPVSQEEGLDMNRAEECNSDDYDYEQCILQHLERHLVLASFSWH